MKYVKLVDPFEGAYFYQCPGVMNTGSYDLWSMGPDGKHGDGGTTVSNAQNRDENDDITNWKSDFN